MIYTFFDDYKADDPAMRQPMIMADMENYWGVDSSNPDVFVLGSRSHIEQNILKGKDILEVEVTTGTGDPSFGTKWLKKSESDAYFKSKPRRELSAGIKGKTLDAGLDFIGGNNDILRFHVKKSTIKRILGAHFKYLVGTLCSQAMGGGIYLFITGSMKSTVTFDNNGLLVDLPSLAILTRPRIEITGGVPATSGVKIPKGR